jgi:hypothetical protein
VSNPEATISNINETIAETAAAALEKFQKVLGADAGDSESPVTTADGEAGISPTVPTIAPILKTSPAKYVASIFPGQRTEVSAALAAKVKDLEHKLNMPVWLLVQNGGDKLATIDEKVYDAFLARRDEIENQKPAALLIESPGGDAHAAYQIARLFQRRSNQFVVIVPSYAKSAATLVALGATSLVMGQDAEIGPLDVQMFEPEKEDYGSALNAVQSLERINAFSMNAIDALTPLLIQRTGKKIDTILPMVLNYQAAFVRPLLERIDTVEFTKKSRELKVAEEYAARLMEPAYGPTVAAETARTLVEKYPTHGFVIDKHEASARLKLKVNKNISRDAQHIIESMIPDMKRSTVIGRIVEIKQ